METETKYLQMLDKIEEKIKRLRDQTAAVRWFYENGDPDESYRRALKLEESAEKAVLLTRALPGLYRQPRCDGRCGGGDASHDPRRDRLYRRRLVCPPNPRITAKEIGRLGGLCPLFFISGNASVFETQPPTRFTDCVLVYRHIYDRTRPERRKRDHDNIEINMVSDIVALYVLPDDAPSVCSHYYCSADGSEDRTEVYVVPRNEFPMWLVTEPTIPDKGVPLHENRLLWRKKPM